MMRKVFIAAGIMLIIVGFVVVGFGWSSWADMQRTAKRRTAARSASKQAEEAQSDKIDTRRDVFVAARSAPRAAALGGGTWINSQPLEVENLRGKVVVVDFWTFGCYNCRNTLPALKRLDARYRERGLVIVGVHAPESDYEKGIDNVRREVGELGIRYPVVTDNDYATWRAYNIQAWPTIVILDKRGRIRFTHIGEGLYEEQERVIQKLLAEESDSANIERDETGTGE